jgi:hypothetical protein
MEFWTAWKVISIGSTGAFGILGLVTEFKDPVTKKLTRWGKASLSGIILSTVFGAAAQLQETSDQQAKAADDAEQNVKISRSTNEAVENIQRLLSQIEEPEYRITLTTPCSGDLYEFCEKLDTSEQRLVREGRFNESPDYAQIWKAWPPHRGSVFYLQVRMYKGPLSEGDEPRNRDPDLQFYLFPSIAPKDSDSIEASVINNTLTLQLSNLHPRNLRSNGHMNSARDLPGSVMYLEWMYTMGSADMQVSWFSFLTKQGLFFVLDPKRFSRKVKPPSQFELGRLLMADAKRDKQFMPKIYDDVEFVYKFDASDGEAKVPQIPH